MDILWWWVTRLEGKVNKGKMSLGIGGGQANSGEKDRVVISRRRGGYGSFHREGVKEE